MVVFTMYDGCLKDPSRKLLIKIQISTIQDSGPTPGSFRALSLESMRTLEMSGCLKDTSMKQDINFQICTILESGPTPGFSIASSKCPPWSQGGLLWFLRGVLVVFDILHSPRIHQGSYWVLQSIIQVSSLESKRTLIVPERSLGGL